jgi:hypothetical protein
MKVIVSQCSTRCQMRASRIRSNSFFEAMANKNIRFRYM